MDEEEGIVYSEWECIMCGAYLDTNRKFCDDSCAEDYHYQNRTCETCGGEFWDGGTSCTCEEE